MTTTPLTDQQHSDAKRCASSHWSLSLACALPRTHRDNWHSGWTVVDGKRRYVRYRRTVGVTEQLIAGIWQPLDIPGPRPGPTREQLLAEVDRLRAERDQARAQLAEADRHVSPRHWPTFAEHAAPEAIAATLAAARQRLRRHEQYIVRLEALQTTRES